MGVGSAPWGIDRNREELIMHDTMMGEAFAEQYGVTAEITLVGEGVGEHDWRHYTWSVVLTNAQGEDLTVPFHTGMLAGEPTVSSVLGCLALDVTARDQSFEDWADDFGYDTDSRKAYDTWEACVRQGKDVYAWCTSEAMWEDFLTVQD